MIKIENVDIWGWEHAIRGMRNPMNSWDRSDTTYGLGEDRYADMVIGPNDLDLMKRLSKAGPPHRKFLRQIFVSVDITAPLYWWKEFDTYKVGTTANSCSTMHKIAAKPFCVDDFSHEHLDGETFPLFADGNLVDGEGKTGDYKCSAWDFLSITCDVLNFYRNKFLETEDKKWWWQMIQLLPSSYNQRRTVTLTYENLLSMLEYRRNHKQDEWREFCKWILTLPYHEVLEIGVCHE